MREDARAAALPFGLGAMGERMLALYRAVLEGKA
jgi:hypothetical protein